MPPKRTIGILIATYNSTNFLGDALTSISSQTQPPDQVIVVDDCSTDGTPAMVADWAKDQAFEVLQLSNPTRAGLPATGRDLGLRQASVDLLALLDHDDLMAPRNLETLSSAFRYQPDLTLAFADAIEFVDDPSEGRSFLSGKQLEPLPYYQTPSGFRIFATGVFESLITGSYVPTMTCLFDRKAAIDAGGFYPQAGTADDGHLWMRLALMGPVGYFPHMLGHKRVHQHNLSHPRNAWKSCRDLRASILAILESDRWKLTDAQRTACLVRVNQLNDAMRYHSSRKGLAAYRETLNLIGDEGFHSKEVLISILHSVIGPRP